MSLAKHTYHIPHIHHRKFLYKKILSNQVLGSFYTTFLTVTLTITIGTRHCAMDCTHCNVTMLLFLAPWIYTLWKWISGKMAKKTSKEKSFLGIPKCLLKLKEQNINTLSINKEMKDRYDLHI